MSNIIRFGIKVGEFLDLDKDVPRWSRLAGQAAVAGTAIVVGALTKEPLAEALGATFLAITTAQALGRSLIRLAPELFEENI